ncbi:Transcriptional regulator TrmB [Furfurilactobacillus rossiae]|uniref:Transcriptional regulator n=2 Tax=Furfurilactobacillus rossiae TaxID=231049 RepID=A0A0R1RJV2_9LACO|nr:hypothetical protein FD35_GL002553 [Furfurilactobacillus rossiae DSM 15814]QFR67399.1 transcriptional regulator [Furfurilactobacillus rossiae]QLE60340.1 Transcriptional regulator TrmB [Furfurilactobacillus rossiae]
MVATTKNEENMDQKTELLTRFGLTESEAKAYVTLLQMDASTGYKISKNSGIARSKIYNVLSSLEDKKFILESKDDTPVYTAIPVDELVARFKTESEHNISNLENSLSGLGTVTDYGSVWALDAYDQVFEKIQYQIQHATHSLYVQIYSEDLTPEITQALADAESRLHEFVVILFSNHHRYDLPFRRFYKHFFEADKVLDYGGRWVNVVSDGQEVVYGKLPADSANTGVIWTKNSSMIFLAQEYVLHDAYDLRTLSLLHDEAEKVFGPDLEGVRDIYFDKN